MTQALLPRGTRCVHADYSGDADPHRAMLAANTAAVVAVPVRRSTKAVWFGLDACQFSRFEGGGQLVAAATVYNARARGLVPLAVFVDLDSLEPADETRFDLDGDEVPCDADDLRIQGDKAVRAGVAYQSNPTDENARLWQIETNQLHKMHRYVRRVREQGGRA
jgi:hypothetical protein